jgi:hypothetical protein
MIDKAYNKFIRNVSNLLIPEQGFSTFCRICASSDYQKYHMAEFSDDDLTAAEERIARQLLTWDADADDTAKSEPLARKEGESDAVRGVKSVKKMPRNRKRKNASSAQLGIPSSDLLVQQSRARYAEAAESVLSRVLVRTRKRLQNPTGTEGERTVSPELVVHKGVPPQAASQSASPYGSAADGPELAHASIPKEVSAHAFVEQHRREVNELGASGLSKKARRDFELRKRQALGCRAPKSQKMPLPMLLGIRKKQREREAKEKEQAIASGMLIRSKRAKKAKL